MNALYADNAFHWWWNQWNDCRVEFVAMGDAVDSSWAQTLVTELKACNLVDAVGCAGYLKVDKSDAADWGDNEMLNCTKGNQPTNQELEAAVLSETDANGSGAPGTDKGLTTLLRQHAVIAVNEGLRFYVYEGGPSLLSANCPILRSTYAVFQNTAPEVGNIVTHELNRFVGGVGLDLLTNWPPDPATGLPFTVEKFGYFAFCQPQDAMSGDFLLITDLYHDLASAVVNTFMAFKFISIKAFNANF